MDRELLYTTCRNLTGKTTMNRVDATRLIARAWLHVLGTSLVFVLLLIPYLEQSLIDGFVTAMAHPEFRTFGVMEWAIHFGLSLCVWAMIVITYQLVAMRRKTGRTIKVSRGSAITETLIILPVWMLLSMGLMQLCITNIAGILTNLATFQAARTVWVWSGESQGQRLGVNYATIMSKARVQAAQSLAPVAPGDYFHDPYFTVSPSLKAARAGMLAQQLPLLTEDQGGVAAPLVYALELEDLKGMTSMGTRGGLNLARSLDASSFRLRSVRKLTAAYHATTVVPITVLGRAGAVVIYRHQIAMPLVPQFFGQLGMVMGRVGYYRVIIREFDYGAQRPANPDFPGGSGRS